LDPLKNHALFFAAAGRLHETNPEVHFLLAGNGVDDRSATVQRWVRDAGVGAVTRLLGQRRDVERLTASLDLATCCSISEAFPNALGEAMCCGVPCVTTAVGDAAEIVGDTGRVVPGDDAEALAGAWRSMLTMPAADRKQLGEAARNRVRSRFEMSVVARQYLRLYESSIGRGARG
jgi:glycosyltransferase involved in cell wall biosynthesis